MAEQASRSIKVQHGTKLPYLNVWHGTLLPDFQTIKSPTGDTLNDTYEVSGVCPLLCCETVSDEHITVTGRQVNVMAPVSVDCQESGSDDNNSYHTLSSKHNGDLRQPHYGALYDLPIEPWDANVSSQRSPREERPDRPTIGVIIAGLLGNETHRDKVTVILCSQKTQQVKLSRTYWVDRSAPSNASIKVLTAETSTQLLINDATGDDTFQYRVQSYLDDNLTKFNENGRANDLTPFLDHILYGPNGTAPDNLLGKYNRQHFIQVVSDLYAQYMRLAIHMRSQPIPDEARAAKLGDEGFFPGTSNIVSSMLQLNLACKLAIQIILGFMFVLGSLTFMSTELRGTLPRKPTSIASRMALLAGSDLCDQSKGLLPQDAIWVSREELDKVTDGWLFSLGWWKRPESHQDDLGEGIPSENETASPQQQKRVGIDVGVPE